MRRPLLLAIGLVALASQPVLAGSPGGACGAAFTSANLAQIREVRSAFPEGLFAAVDSNLDGVICYMELKAPDSPSPNSGHLNLVDDNVPVH